MEDEPMTSASSSSSVALRNVPPGFRFNPTPIELFKCYYMDKAKKGCCNWDGVILEGVNVLEFQPQDLPGIDPETHEAYYFYQRDHKKSKSKNNTRIISGTTGFWRRKSSTKTETVEEEIAGTGKKKLVWGTKTTLNHYSAPKTRTDWAMDEYVLDPSRAKLCGDDIVLCKVYKNKGKDNGDDSGNEIPISRWKLIKIMAQLLSKGEGFLLIPPHHLLPLKPLIPRWELHRV